jgi:hypothetical protein
MFVLICDVKVQHMHARGHKMLTCNLPAESDMIVWNILNYESTKILLRIPEIIDKIGKSFP